MDSSLLVNALMYAVYLSVPVLVAVLCGALVAGVLKVATQIDDQAVNFAGKLTAVALLMYLAAGRFVDGITAYTAGIWGNSNLYH
jgi:flagellar biosynthesis protein FliQ